MNFQDFLLLAEALDAKLKDILLKGKYGENTPEQIQAAVDELEQEYEGKDGPDKGTAFKFMQNKLGLKAGEVREVPKDPFFAKYYEKLKKKQIFPEEYKTLELFKNQNKEVLEEMMTKLREFISNNKIILSFDTKPKIKFKGELLDNYKNFTEFMSIIHSIEGQLADVNVDKYQNPAFLEMLQKGDLVAKGKNIWVFKGDDPLKCRIMGKGQVWCISSSTSVHYYFDYRHRYGQTQYFIFDFNKAPEDPARYVNPGVAPEGGYSEWVDRRNTHPEDPDGVAFGINGYNSLKEYLAYLQSKGVDTSVFKPDPVTDEEKKLREFINNNDFEGARNYPDERKTKDGIPYMFYYYLKIIQRLTDQQFDSLSDIEKQEFLLGKSHITAKQFNYVKSKGLKFIKEYMNSIDNIEGLLENAENKDEMAKFIIQNKKELDDSNVRHLLTYAKNQDNIIDLITQHKEINSFQILLMYARNKDRTIESIIKNKKELTGDQVYRMIQYAEDKGKIAELLGSKNLDKLSDTEIEYVSNFYSPVLKRLSKLRNLYSSFQQSEDNVIKFMLNHGFDDIKYSKLAIYQIFDYALKTNKFDINSIIKYFQNNPIQFYNTQNDGGYWGRQGGFTFKSINSGDNEDSYKTYIKIKNLAEKANINLDLEKNTESDLQNILYHAKTPKDIEILERIIPKNKIIKIMNSRTWSEKQNSEDSPSHLDDVNRGLKIINDMTKYYTNYSNDVLKKISQYIKTISENDAIKFTINEILYSSIISPITIEILLNKSFLTPEELLQKINEHLDNMKNRPNFLEENIKKLKNIMNRIESKHRNLDITQDKLSNIRTKY